MAVGLTEELLSEAKATEYPTRIMEHKSKENAHPEITDWEEEWKEGMINVKLSGCFEEVFGGRFLTYTSHMAQ